MAKITKVETQKRHNDRVNIFLDEEFFCSMYLDVAIKYGLKAGVEINEEKLQRYIAESERSIAVNKAVKYMSTNLKTRKQLRTYLVGKGYSNDTIEYVLNKLQEYGFVNDENYVASYINTYGSKYGKNMLKQKLIEKGVGKNILDDQFEDYESKSEDVYKLAVKKIGNKPITQELLTKTIRFLAGRGFDYENIKTVINQIKSEKNAELENENESWD